MNDLKRLTHTYLGAISKVGIVLVLISSLFLFGNLTTEFYDTPKFLVLLVVTGVLLVLLALKSTVENRLVFVRTPLDIPLLLLISVGVVSTILSLGPYVSLLGNQLRVSSSLVALIVYVLFYFVLVNSLKTQKTVTRILYITSLGAGVLSVISLLAYLGLKLLPAPWSHGINFTTTGSSFTTTAILALFVPVVASQILTGNLVHKLINATLLTLFGVTIALTGTTATWVAALLGLFLVFVTNRVYDKIRTLKPITLVSLAVPLAAVVLVVILSFIPPMGKASNPLYTQSKNFPKEIQLSFITSWKVAISTFRDNPFWGSGPGTFLFDFTNYKPIEFNSSKEWNIRFDSAFNEYFQILATLGGVGLIALISLTALFISSSYSSLIHLRDDVSSEKRALAISGLIFFVILALHSSTLVLWVVGFFILASFMVLTLPQGISRSWNSPNIRSAFLTVARNISSHASEEIVRVEALPSILLTVSLGLVLFTFFFAGKFALADYHHRLALNAVAQNNGILAYNELIAAEKLNPNNDLYRTDLAQINFKLANAIASAKAPTEASPGGSLTDQDKQNIQVLLQQSINEGKAATTLSPRSALNWEILGLLYRQIAGVAQNALVFSLDSYGRAIFQDPLNPNLRLSVGGVYYAVQSYDQAIRFFTDAINLKPDFANGYYNLSVALRDKGDLVNAQATGEKVLTLVEKDSKDYKLVQSYLVELKAKTSTTTPPAAKTSGSLQEEKLPKVVDVGNPPTNIATPSAVKKPNSTPEPSPAP